MSICFHNFFTFCGLYAIYTIIIDNKIFEIMDVYIFKFVIYKMIAYILPIILDMNILINLVFIFKIIEAAYKIILFMITFSKKITSKYIVIFITFFLFIYCTTIHLKILSFFSMCHNYLIEYRITLSVLVLSHTKRKKAIL